MDKRTYFLINQLPGLTMATSFSLAHLPPPQILASQVMQRGQYLHHLHQVTLPFEIGCAFLCSLYVGQAARALLWGS